MTNTNDRNAIDEERMKGPTRVVEVTMEITAKVEVWNLRVPADATEEEIMVAWRHYDLLERVYDYEDHSEVVKVEDVHSEEDFLEKNLTPPS